MSYNLVIKRIGGFRLNGQYLQTMKSFYESFPATNRPNVFNKNKERQKKLPLASK